MKSKFTFLSILILLTAFVVSAQDVEYDDMYFRSKDRSVLTAVNSMTLKSAAQQMEIVSTINPTDSYSARNVNPEYLSQSKVNPTSKNQEPVAYFLPDYVPTAVNQKIYNNPQNSSYAGSAWNSCCNYGMGLGMMSSNYPYRPYSSSFGYDPYSPYGYNSMYGGGYNSMYGSGWSSGLSFTMGFGGFGGSPWNYGMNYGMGYGGGYYGYNSGMYRPQVIITGGGDAGGQGVVYGKRASRSTDIDNYVSNSNRSSTTVVDSQGRARGSSGRIADSENNAAGSYYQRGWRSDPETNTTRSSWSNSGRTTDNSTGFYNDSNRSGDSNNSWYNSNTSGSRSSGGSGSSNFSTGGGGSRSSGGSSSGSSSGGASRSRN